MAKKKAVKKTKKAPKSSHGELFDKHPNLIWLMPIFLIIAGIAVVVIYNNYNAPVENIGVMEEEIMIDDATLDSTSDATEEMMLEEEVEEDY